jgi:hypothetical protein
MAQLPRNYVEEVELVTQPVATEIHDVPVATAEAQVRRFKAHPRQRPATRWAHNYRPGSQRKIAILARDSWLALTGASLTGPDARCVDQTRGVTMPRTSMARELAIGSGAIAVAGTTAARFCRSGSWRRSGRRQG